MVIIKYKLFSNATVHELKLDDKAYYDPLEDSSETYFEDGVAKHLEPWEYLNINTDDIQWLILRELDKTCRYQFFGQQETFTNHVLWKNGTEEIISSTYLGNNKVHILRVLKKADSDWVTTVNSVDAESEQTVMDTWSNEDLGTFGTYK